MKNLVLVIAAAFLALTSMAQSLNLSHFDEVNYEDEFQGYGVPVTYIDLEDKRVYEYKDRSQEDAVERTLLELDKILMGTGISHDLSVQDFMGDKQFEEFSYKMDLGDGYSLEIGRSKLGPMNVYTMHMYIIKA